MAYEKLNDWSIVLMVRYAGRSILLTGDVEAEAEADMLTHADILPLSADVLKVAHHGSDSSSTAPFVAAVCPRFAIVSCNFAQNQGYPSIETAMTLYDCGVEDVFTTATHGNITVLIESNGRITIATER